MLLLTYFSHIIFLLAFLFLATFPVLHPALRRQLDVFPLDGAVDVQIVDTNSIEESSRSLQSEIKRGNISVEVLPVDDKVESTSSIASSKPWRLPLSVGLSMNTTVEEQPVFQADRIGLQKFEDLVPICSGAVIPRAFVVGEQASEDNHTCKLSILRMTGGNEGIDAPAIPFPVLYLQNLPSLVALSRQVKRKNDSAVKALTFQEGEGDEALRLPSPLQEREKYLALNLLPSAAGFLKDSVAWALSLAKEVKMASTNRIWPYRTLLVGTEGTGKTHLALVTAALARLHFGMTSSYLDCRQLQSAPENQMCDILDELSLLFDEAAAKTISTLLIIDNIHAIVPNVDASNDDDNDAMHHQQTNPALSAQVKLISDHVYHLLDQNPSVCVLATCTNATGIAPSLRTLECFSSMVHVPTLETKQRIDLFQLMLRRMSETSLSFALGSSADITMSFGRQTEGYAPLDVLAVAGRVAHALHINTLGRRDWNDATDPTSNDCLHNLIQENIKNYIPASQQGLHIGKTDVLVEWEDIGGLFQAKAVLTDIILRPVRYRAIYQNAPISLPRGIMLYGPGGTGKSLIVPALAKECNFNLVRCNGPELLDKYIGASEAKVRQLFARAYAAAPCILFLDDFDALAPRRGSDHTGVTDRVVNQLLTFLDGVESADDRKGMVYVIGATSRPGEKSGIFWLNASSLLALT